MGKNKIKKFREKLGYSQTVLAAKSGVAAQNISAFERGTLAVWPAAQRKLSEALGTPQYILFPENGSGKAGR